MWINMYKSFFVITTVLWECFSFHFIFLNAVHKNRENTFVRIRHMMRMKAQPHVHICMEKAKCSSHCMKKKQHRVTWKEWKWNLVPGLSVCAPALHVKSQRGRHGQRSGSGGGGGDKRRRIFTCENETVGSLRCRWWQTIQAAAAEKRWSSEWHQAAGVDIHKQNAVNAKSHMTVSTLEDKGIHHLSGTKTIIMCYIFMC